MLASDGAIGRNSVANRAIATPASKGRAMEQPNSSIFNGAVRPAPVPAAITPAGDMIDGFLRAVRTHLDLQVAYVSQFVGDESLFQHVDAPGLEGLIKPGDRRSLDDVYCRHILAGRLPELIPDTAAEPLAMAMPITAAVPIGAHVSVPLRLSDGSVYGMFCCLGPHADHTLNRRDLAMMRSFAELAAGEIERRQASGAALAALRAPVEQLLADGGPTMMFQPIWRLGEGRPAGYEALARFSPLPSRGPDQWFADAAAVGLAEALELAAVDRALLALPRLPQDRYLTINVSPATAMSPALVSRLAQADLKRLVLEITEQQAADDVPAMLAALAPLRAAGMRLAVDDAGAGYSGLQAILELQPDIIKLDRFFVRGIHNDATRRALAAALAEFARQIGTDLVAEGVEVAAELSVLQALGFDKVQGWLLGKAMPLEDALALA